MLSFDTLHYTPVLADMIWSAMFLQERIVSVWVITGGLFIEYFFVWGSTSLSSWRAFLANLLMNAVSLLLGIILIPVAGIIWEFFPGILLYKVFNLGSFNPYTWTATFCMAVLINSGLEISVLNFIFQQPFEQSLFWWLCLANSLSVGIAMATFLIYPPRQGAWKMRKKRPAAQIHDAK